MAGEDTFTPNLDLRRIGADKKNWADKMNANLTMIDAAISTFVRFNDLQGPWANNQAYTAGQTVVDVDTAVIYTANINHISATVPTTFAGERAAHPTYWSVAAAPAANRGAWEGPGTVYNRNDFVLAEGVYYAFALSAHTSGATFLADVALGLWEIVIDLSAVGSLVLPVLTPVADANKFLVVNSAGTGYVLASAGVALANLGVSSIGVNLITAGSEAGARSAINAQIAGSYQASNANLDTLSAATLTAYGVSVLGVADAAALRTLAGLGTAAVLAATAILQVANNLSDLANATTARSNLGVAYASTAEMEIGTATDRVVAPGTQPRHPGHPKAFATADFGGTLQAGGAFNMASVTDTGTGLITFTFTTAFSSTAYTVIASGEGNGLAFVFSNRATGSVRLNSVNTNSQVLQDGTVGTILCFGDQ